EGPTFREYCDASPATGSPTCLRDQMGARVGADSAANRTVLVPEGDGACHQPGPLRGIKGRPRIASPEASASLRRWPFPAMSAERGWTVPPRPNPHSVEAWAERRRRDGHHPHPAPTAENPEQVGVQLQPGRPVDRRLAHPDARTGQTEVRTSE